MTEAPRTIYFQNPDDPSDLSINDAYVSEIGPRIIDAIEPYIIGLHPQLQCTILANLVAQWVRGFPSGDREPSLKAFVVITRAAIEGQDEEAC